MNDEPQDTIKKMKYTGPEMCTRGEYGERVEFGHMDSTGAIYVWDTLIGWVFWTTYQGDGDQEWRPA